MKKFSLVISAILLFIITGANAQTILVTSLNKGVYAVGDTLLIQWITKPGCESRPVQISIRDFRYDPNTTGEDLIVGSYTNTGTYSWVIPPTVPTLEFGCDSPVYHIAMYLGNGGMDSFAVSSGFSISHTPTGIAGNKEIVSPRMLAYPNPSNGTFIIDFPGVWNALLVDMSGRMVYSFSGEDKVQVSQSFAPGIYVLSLESETGIHTERIIIQ